MARPAGRDAPAVIDWAGARGRGRPRPARSRTQSRARRPAALAARFRPAGRRTRQPGGRMQMGPGAARQDWRQFARAYLAEPNRKRRRQLGLTLSWARRGAAARTPGRRQPAPRGIDFPFCRRASRIGRRAEVASAPAALCRGRPTRTGAGRLGRDHWSACEIVVRRGPGARPRRRSKSAHSEPVARENGRARRDSRAGRPRGGADWSELSGARPGDATFSGNASRAAEIKTRAAADLGLARLWRFIIDLKG